MNGHPAFIPIIETVLDQLPSSDYWCKGSMERGYVNEDGTGLMQRCLAGAAAEAFRKLGLTSTDRGFIRDRGSLVDAFRSFAETQSTIDHNGFGVVAWNDSPETTYEDVVLWAKSLIDHCRGDG